MAKVLIVEDDSVIADGMARHLAAAGFDPVVAPKGDQGLARLRFERPEVVVLDLMLPGRAGCSASSRSSGGASSRATSSSRNAGDGARRIAIARSTCSCGDYATRWTAAPRDIRSSRRATAWATDSNRWRSPRGDCPATTRS